MRTSAISRLLLISTLTLASVNSACSEELEPSGDSRTLVAYFSATRNTRAIATRIAELTGADIYEIEAAEPYAANPYDDSDRIQNEAYNDLRPGVGNLPSEQTIARYDTIYVGSPLWWHQPAMVVCTFLESYDLSGKVVVPFMTYGATTYLNEGMQKLFKSSPGAIHVPEELPEDLDPDNIREPQNDDAGIDHPTRESQVEGWLRRMNLWPPQGSAGVRGDVDGTGFFSVTRHEGGIAVTVSEPAYFAIYDTAGGDVCTGRIASSRQISLDRGLYVLNLSSGSLTATRKIMI